MKRPAGEVHLHALGVRRGQHLHYGGELPLGHTPEIQHPDMPAAAAMRDSRLQSQLLAGCESRQRMTKPACRDVLRTNLKRLPLVGSDLSDMRVSTEAKNEAAAVSTSQLPYELDRVLPEVNSHICLSVCSPTTSRVHPRHE
jgi:hypothetical protein